MTELLLIISILVIIYLAYLLFQKRKQLERYEALQNLEAEEARLKKENLTLASANKSLQEKGLQIREAITKLNHDLADLEDQQALQEFGMYKAKYDFGTSVGYKAKLDEIRNKQKNLIRQKDVVIWDTEWVVEGNKAKGKKMMTQRTKMTLIAFNGECDSLILKTKYNNVNQISQRIRKLYDSINKINEPEKSRLNPKYLDLKIQELYVYHEYKEKIEAEKEEQRLIREQMREEQKAQKEIERAQREAEKEEERYQKALEKAKAELAKAEGDTQTKLQEEIHRLNLMLTEAHDKKERAISRAQMTKSGHVYIISNIGSFGENVYKIGMTRRLEPLDRVKELGDASVPFLFDVHAMIYSENAPELERQLHKAFDNNRINLVNNRKEYFYVPLEEIELEVKKNEHDAEMVITAEAQEYRKTLALRAESKLKLETPISEDALNDLFGV